MMLPILRILPVGGVLLAILLLAVTVTPPDGSRAHLTPYVAPARGALIERGEHPEWRQFLILAAIQRADELNRLRELPDTPTVAAPSAPEVASLPTDRSDSDPEDNDESGSIIQPPAATIPVDIGESSSIELPVAAPEEKPPVIKTPQRVRSRNEGRIRGALHARRARALAKPEPLPQLNFFGMLFGPPPTKRQPAQQQPIQQQPTVDISTNIH
jgi:hypothetical protein